MVFPGNKFMQNAIDCCSDDKVYKMIEFGSGWLTANDPVFWCLAPAHLEEVVWLFRAAPIKQPCDFWGHPITLLNYYLRMDLLELLDSLWFAPIKIRKALCTVWLRTSKRHKLSTQNYLNYVMGPELDWLFERNPDLPPSWEVIRSPSGGGVCSYRVALLDWITEETEL